MCSTRAHGVRPAIRLLRNLFCYRAASQALRHVKAHDDPPAKWGCLARAAMASPAARPFCTSPPLHKMRKPASLRPPRRVCVGLCWSHRGADPRRDWRPCHLPILEIFSLVVGSCRGGIGLWRLRGLGVPNHPGWCVSTRSNTPSLLEELAASLDPVGGCRRSVPGCRGEAVARWHSVVPVYGRAVALAPTPPPPAPCMPRC